MSDIENDFNVTLPMSELLKLISSCKEIPYLIQKVDFLSNRVDGLSSIYLQILDELKDIKSKM